jgi:hypothetical protein
LERNQFLLSDRCAIVRVLDRNVGFKCEKTGERVALLLGELSAETVCVHEGLTLLRRHLAQVAEGAGYEELAVLRKSAVLLNRTLDLLSLLRSEVLHLLVALNNAPALLWSHIVELSEAIAYALLRLRWKITEARLILKGTLLLCR